MSTEQAGAGAAGITAPPTADREIVLTRTLDAPRELVFRAWTDPEHVGRWWGPRGFTTTVYEMDVRPGGVWRYMMHGPDGTDYPNLVEYVEVTPPGRLVYWHGSDQHDGPDRFHVTVTFEEQDGGTALTMRMLFRTAGQREKTVEFGAVELGYQTLDRLAEHLAGDVAAGATADPLDGSG